MNILTKSVLLTLLVSAALMSCKKEDIETSVQKNATIAGVDKNKLSTVLASGVPASLYLILPGNASIQLTKNGDVFNSTGYVPLQENVNYYFNTKVDGSGTSYFINETLSAYGYADDDKVSWDNPLQEVISGTATFQVARSQAYKLTLDFNKTELNWQYHNIKLFYYTDWDQRTEVMLDYEHPLTFKKTIQLPANNDMKFYSVNPDWLEWGASDPQSLVGTIPASGGADIVAVTDAGSYVVSMTLDNQLQAGTYSFAQESPLPITLTSFTAKYAGGAVSLNWKTSFESNVKGFVIEKTEDGKNISSLPGLIKPGKTSYSTIDDKISSNKTYYYRLKTIDLDGKTQHSNFVAVSTKN